MKKVYFGIAYLILLTASNAVFGQLTIDPNPGYTDVAISEDDAVIYGFVTNESNETKSFLWNRQEIAITEGWESAVCDDNTCYLPHIGTAPQSFELTPGEAGTLDVHVYPNGIEGSAIIEVTVSEVGNFTNNATGTYYFNESVSVPERLNEAVALYPNPASDQIFIDKGAAVERIEFYSLSGRLVMNASLNQDNVVSVGHLSTGTYVARIFDKDGIQVSSNVMIKK